MRSLGSWFSGVIDSVRLMVGLYDLEGLLQHKQFYDSMSGYSVPFPQFTWMM